MLLAFPNHKQPRTTIRERLRNAAAKILPRMSWKHRKGGGHEPARRAFVAGSLASVVVPSPTRAADDRSGDAALFRLCADYERAFARHEEISLRQGEAVGSIFEQLDQEMPRPARLQGRANDDECVAWGRARDARFMEIYRSRSDYQAPDNEAERLWDEVLDPLANAIRDAVPVTLAGVCLKARFLIDRGHTIGFWQSEGEDPSEQALLAFLEQVAALSPAA